MDTRRRILITGGASGLGLALARRHAARGDRVLATDVAADRPDSIPAGVEYLSLDVRDEAAWDAAVDHVRASWGGLDVLYNNAGVASGGPLVTTTMDEWQWIIDINLLGVVRGSRAFVPMFFEQGGGHLVNTASLAGLVHAGGMSEYNAVKAAVVALSETLSHELHGQGVAVSVVCPSFFQTNLADSMRGDDESLRAGRSLIENSKRTADDIAERVIKGVDAGKDYILPDIDGQVIWRLKRFARPIYRTVMRQAAAKVAAKAVARAARAGRV